MFVDKDYLLILKDKYLFLKFSLRVVNKYTYIMINQLVTYCDNEVDNATACNHALCNGADICNACLEGIHTGNGRDYDCYKMLNTYVCKYIYKYSSEIAHLFRGLNTFGTMDGFNIASIGCGPCPDLFAAYYSYNTKPINYFGFDTNNGWQNSHNQIEYIFRNQTQINLNFHYQDIFSCYSTLGIVPNILVLSYLISHIVRHGDIINFLNNLNDIIIQNMPIGSIIIINDINHNTLARNYFGYLFDLLNAGDDDSYINRRFSFLGGWNYGDRYNGLSLIADIPPNIALKYDTWTTSTSAQMIIKKVE